MKDSNKRVHVQILDKEYQVACPAEEKAALLSAAEELDVRMRKVRNSGAIIGADRIAVMVALNLCYELQQAKNALHQNHSRDSHSQDSHSRDSDIALDRLAEKLRTVLETRP